MKTDLLAQVRKGWFAFADLLFAHRVSRADRAAWLATTVAALGFALSTPVMEVHPLLGHLLFLGQFLAILIPAARAGWAGAWGGLLLSTCGFLATLTTVALLPGGAPEGVLDVEMVIGVGIILTLACGWFGESARTSRRLMLELARAEERLGALINAMPSGLLMMDRAGHILYSNHAARRLLTTEAPEEFGLSVRALVAEEAWPLMRSRILDPKTGEPMRVTIPGERALRTEWVFARVTDQGQPRTLAFLWDAEEKLLREEESRALAAALRCLQEGVVLANLDGTIRYANPAAAQIYGYAERGEMFGTTLREHVTEQDLAGFEDRMEQARDTGGACEIRLRRHDGGETEVHVTTSPVRSDGALIGTIGVIRDLTEAKVIARRASAADKQATLGRLVAGAAHEINNPLAGILTGAELLRDEPGLSPEGAARLETIQVECARAGRIVRDLLAFARQRPVSRTPVEFAEVVRSAVALREGYTRSAGIELTLHAPSPAPVQVDVDQIKQVVLNLLMNAEDAVTGAPVRRIGVTIGQRGGHALLLVNDSGPGVPDALQSQIFEPFFTTKPEGHGTGLGLAVSIGIVGEHGGRISVARGVLGGAQFAVELPLCTPAEIPVRPARRSTDHLKAPRRRILVVDDEPSILNAVGRILQRLGHEVRTAATGGDALGLAVVERFDLIISDLRMPGMSGRELHAELTKEGVLPAADFIVATGDIADPEAFTFLQSTGLPVLLKPFEIRDLVELLGRTRPCAATEAPMPVLDRAG
jgi:PAS domain S-box-containing protein